MKKIDLTIDLHNKKTITILVILTLISFLSGGTYAYLSLVASNEEDSTVLTAGNLKLQFSQGAIIENKKFYPITAPTSLGDTNEHTYQNAFTITNIGTFDGLVRISIRIDESGFENNALKYALYGHDGSRIAEGSLPQSGTIEIFNNLILVTNDSIEYTLQLWLEETYTNQSEMMKKELSATIIVDADQIMP